jgi:zinc transporter
MPTVTKLNESASGGEAAPRTVAWIDIDTSDPADRAWLAAEDSLGAGTRDRLLQPVLVSRREVLRQGLLISLRISTDISVNGPADPASLSILISDDQVVTVRSEAIPIIDVLRAQLDEGKGPSSPLQFLAQIATSQSEHIEGIIAHISKDTDELEDQLLDDDSTSQGEALNALRRRVYQLRRQLAALRHVLMLIVSDPSVDLDQSESSALAKTAELATRHLENLEDCRIRIQLLQDQIEGRLAASMAQSSYNLTIVATVFLPLTFITGLLGMNVAGIPEAHNPRGFWTVCILLTIFAAVSWAALRWRARG